jgi:endo-alpha-1,4-polygalactosaminidase (GH114 family)
MQVTDSMISEIDVSKDSATLAIAVESLLSWRNQKKKKKNKKKRRLPYLSRSDAFFFKFDYRHETSIKSLGTQFKIR